MAVIFDVDVPPPHFPHQITAEYESGPGCRRAAGEAYMVQARLGRTRRLRQAQPDLLEALADRTCTAQTMPFSEARCSSNSGGITQYPRKSLSDNKTRGGENRAGKGTVLALTPDMECYFGSSALPHDNQTGKSSVVMFHIPEVGIRFKAPFDAVDPDHGDLASLLALLEFIDSNQKYFSKHTYQLYGNNHRVINQLNNREEPHAMFEPLMQKAETYRRKYRFSVQWVPTWDNSALDSLLD